MRIRVIGLRYKGILRRGCLARLGHEVVSHDARKVLSAGWILSGLGRV
jgi:UDP-glucose 6-dehydrogenase